MQLGDTVKWKSQAKGYSKVKEGKIVVVIPAGDTFPPSGCACDGDAIQLYSRLRYASQT